MSNSSKQPEYYLLNKDVKIASFSISEMLQLIEIQERFQKLPEHYKYLAHFISSRRTSKNRQNMLDLLRISKCKELRGFLDNSHALSLNDTFWVKSVDSDLCWKDVSLYDKPFNTIYAGIALWGADGYEGNSTLAQLTSLSPELTTGGSFAKCWIRENDTIKMLKRGSTGARNAGLESYSEYYASQLIAVLTNNYVKYDLRKIGGEVCSVCDIFTSEDYGFLPYAALDTSNNTDINTIFKITESKGINTDTIKTMIIADAIILNEDRHKNNFGFMVDNKSLKIEGFAPLFDYNISLLPYAEEDNFEDIDNYLKRKGPRIYDDWFSAAASVLDHRTKKVLIDLLDLLDFKFERHPKYNLPEWRLEALENVIHDNIKKILTIAE